MFFGGPAEIRATGPSRNQIENIDIRMPCNSFVLQMVKIVYIFRMTFSSFVLQMVIFGCPRKPKTATPSHRSSTETGPPGAVYVPDANFQALLLGILD